MSGGRPILMWAGDLVVAVLVGLGLGVPFRTHRRCISPTNPRQRRGQPSDQIKTAL